MLCALKSHTCWPVMWENLFLVRQYDVIHLNQLQCSVIRPLKCLYFQDFLEDLNTVFMLICIHEHSNVILLTIAMHTAWQILKMNGIQLYTI